MEFTLEELNELKTCLGNTIFIIAFARSMEYPFTDKLDNGGETAKKFFIKLGGFTKTVEEILLEKQTLESASAVESDSSSE